MLRNLISLAAAAAITTAAGASTQPQPSKMWEEVTVTDRRDLQPQAASSTTDEQGPEIIVRDHNIYLSVPRQMAVEIFTILGQPVSRETLRAGIHRLKFRSRGIYILRAGGVTRRITI